MKTLEQVKPMRNELNDASHTPGPWHVLRRDGEALSVRSGFQNVCVVPHPDRVEIGRNPRWMANAALISAAPELLAALEALMDEADMGEVDEETRPIVDAARAAIAKAKGEVYTPVF